LIALLGVTEGRRATKREDEFAPPYLDCHETVLWEVNAQAMEATISRFDRVVCGKSAYPPILSMNADMRAQRLSAKTGPEQMQQ